MSEQFLTTGLIFAFGVICLLTLYCIMRMREHGWGEYSTRIIILIMVLTLGGVIVSSPTSPEKSGQLLTLCGFIVGYVLASWGGR
jgi:hypothetical protein